MKAQQHIHLRSEPKPGYNCFKTVQKLTCERSSNVSSAPAGLASETVTHAGHRRKEETFHKLRSHVTPTSILPPLLLSRLFVFKTLMPCTQIYLL